MTELVPRVLSSRVARALVLSDVHFEFHRDGGYSFVESLATDDVDLVLLAGDVTNAAGLTESLTLFAERFSCPIAYVHGNHEFYGSNREAVVAATRAVARRFPHFHWLDNDVLDIAGVRVAGTTLWFRKAPGAPTWAMNDFVQIASFESWVYDENEKARVFLEREMGAADIVLTHYLPAKGSIDPRFEGNALNVFFLCDLGEMIERAGPALWVHGHTHESCDYELGATRIVCNPFGYAGYELNSAFEDAKLVVVGQE